MDSTFYDFSFFNIEPAIYLKLWVHVYYFSQFFSKLLNIILYSVLKVMGSIESVPIMIHPPCLYIFPIIINTNLQLLIDLILFKEHYEMQIWIRHSVIQLGADLILLMYTMRNKFLINKKDHFTTKQIVREYYFSIN